MIHFDDEFGINQPWREISMNDAKEFEYLTVIKNSDYLVRDHRVQQVRTMPGVTFIDLVYRCLSKENFDLNCVELRNILFKQPVVTTESFDQQLQITFKSLPGGLAIQAGSRKTQNGKPLESVWKENFQTELYFDKKTESKNINIAQLKRNSYQTVDMDSLYAAMRNAGIDHYDFMKPQGAVYSGTDFLLAELNLGILADQYLNCFYLHPVFLDGATILGSTGFTGLQANNSNARPFIPIHIESFQALARLTSPCYIYVKKQDARVTAAPDIFYSDAELYNEDGKRCAYFRKLGVKQVRSESVMKNLAMNVSPKGVGAPHLTLETTSLSTSDPEPGQAMTAENRAMLVQKSLELDLQKIIAGIINKSISDINLNASYYDQGLSSGDLLQIVQYLERRLGRQLYPTLLFEYNNIGELAGHLAEKYSEAIGTVPPALDWDSATATEVMYYCHQWIESPMSLPLSPGPICGDIIIFDHNNDLRHQFKLLPDYDGAKHRIVLVTPGASFKLLDRETLTINPDNPDDYHLLLEFLETGNFNAAKIIHMWSQERFVSDPEVLDRQLKQGIYSMLYLTQAMMRHHRFKTGPLIYFYLNRASGTTQPQYNAVAGFLKTVGLEHPDIKWKVMEFGVSGNPPDPSQYRDVLVREFRDPDDNAQEVLYQGQRRYVKSLIKVVTEKKLKRSWAKENGVYLITGGLGALGLIFAEYLAKQLKVNLVLCGRSEASAAKMAKIQALEALGSKVIYIKADVANRQEVIALIRKTKSVFSGIDGVIHCAGITQDALVLNKTPQAVAAVLAPKVYGTVFLDEALRDEKLDFFVLCSSTTAIMGNVGQSDYAYGNCFLDNYAQLREELRTRKRRTGKTLALNWPLWRQGGMMAIDAQVERFLVNEKGMTPLDTPDGLQAWETALMLPVSQVMVIAGDEARLAQTFQKNRLPLVAGAGSEITGPQIQPEALPAVVSRDTDAAGAEAIAVIGLGGRYPMSGNIEQLWENLKKGKDCITEIPKDRWDYREFYDATKNTPGKTYCKWGGFIEHVDRFDPLFFNIAPREAEMLDPQERLFLEVAWETIEDAGYTRERLGNNIGVFVGVMWGQYQLFGMGPAAEANSVSGSFFSSIPNRVSYALNLKGPSLAVDTACSSSLEAIRLACLNIIEGNCEMAIAGGVNLSLHPNKYLFLAQANFLSSDGKCRSFGEGGDGYVPGEGVGAVLLKPLKKAVTDGDQIYAVIKGYAVNHGGKTSGYTVPSPNAQAELIARALKKAQMAPRTISCIEAHGTGTALGDPIEISGLIKAFGNCNGERQFCSLGSIKSNMGHLESAAGIAAFTKVLLQLKHKQLAPSLHSEQINSKINLDESPFYLQHELTPWRSPVINENGHESKYPRRAGISAFGAGGTNVHIILEEFDQPQLSLGKPDNERQIIILSAQSKEQLQVYVQNMIGFLEKSLVGGVVSDIKDNPDQTGPTLADLAYTLQIGREAMEERLALVVQSKAELLERLKDFVNGAVNQAPIFCGNTRQRQTMAYGEPDEDLRKLFKAWLEKGKWDKLAELWSGGVKIDWDWLRSGQRGRIISLPTYPFARERYWLAAKDNQLGGRDLKRADDAEYPYRQMLHPLVPQNKKTAVESLIGSVGLAPVWDETTVCKGEIFPAPSDRIFLVGGTRNERHMIERTYPEVNILDFQEDDSIATMARKIEANGFINHILWIVPHHPLQSLTEDALIVHQNQGVFKCFRLIKALLRLGYGDRDLGFSFITVQTQPIHKNDSVNPTHASLHGLIGTMAKEYPNWRIRLIDLDAAADWPWEEIFNLGADPRGNAWVYRNGRWYRQRLIPIRRQPPERTIYKPGGVYVVIGGAGGIGNVWSEYMIRTYHAQLVWIGRRPQDAEITAKLDRLASLGIKPDYIMADAAVQKDLSRAYAEIKQRYSRINGVIHSAVGILDRSLANCDEERFRAGLAAKLAVSVRIAQVFLREPLDFVLFFSSVGAFGKASGQSSYASGCTFVDTFAHQLSREWPAAVKVINWGYWGNVGVGSIIPNAFKKRLVQAGIGNIEPPEAMEALETFLAGPLNQIALLKIIRPEAFEGIDFNEAVMVYPGNNQLVIPSMWNAMDKHGLRWDERIELPASSIRREWEGLLCELLWCQLQSTGWFREKSSAIADLKQQIGLCDFYGRWLDESLAYLVRNHFLRCNDGLYEALRTEPPDSGAVWQKWQWQRNIWLEDPNLKNQVLLVETTLRALPQILTGKIPATEIMFPNSSMELVEGIYKNNAVADYFNEALADMVVAYIRERLKSDASAQIRIIEIGAGTGGTSAVVLAKLRPYRGQIQEYCYTDISKAFLIHAEQEYGRRNPYVTYKLFNVEVPAGGQDISLGEYDLAIATNVLHATRNIRQTLRNVKAVLKNRGLILINEISQSSLFTHLTFGLLEGWWRYEDTELRLPGCPGLAFQTWQKVLESEGFGSILGPVPEAHQLGQQLIVAESDGVVRQKQEPRQPPIPSAISPAQPKADSRIGQEEPGGEKSPISPMSGTTPGHLREKTKAYLLKLIGETLKISYHRIDPAEPLEKYGIDSLLIVQITNVLSQVFNNISSTLLFECQTIDALTEYFLKNQKEPLVKLFGFEERLPAGEVSAGTGAVAEMATDSAVTAKQFGPHLRFSDPETVIGKSESVPEPIAIIGISGRYPQAKNPKEYWENLKAGKDCVTEMAGERWSLEGFFHPDPQQAVAQGKSYSKWGGFIDGFADFDPLFFNISPREAINMDPQERLFMESCWEVFEDAGYTREILASKYRQRIGVFVGITRTGFDLYGPELLRVGEPVYPHTSFSSAANRVSYFLNLQGPSMAIDTQCSASLIAVHEACEHIRRGECEMAVAGGVNLYLHPSSYIGLCAAKMLSTTNRSSAFGQGGNGFVPGEGVGCILLKSLFQAVRDRDQIYAVILGTNTNHNGKTNGYMVPNPHSQSSLIVENFKKSGVNPRTVSYVESAAYGSNLGDPIELAALTKAFSSWISDLSFCAIGSVKPNIGHLEAASGISQLTKVILQLQYRQLVPSLNAEPANPNIDFTHTPFYVQRELQEWRRPIITVNGEERELPRRATVSSFGAGGSNAHLIIEEYIPHTQNTVQPSSVNLPQIVVFSAKNQDRLQAKLQQMLVFSELNPELCLRDLAYTLQVGREAMKSRLAMVVNTREELIRGLNEYLKVQVENRELKNAIPIFTGNLAEHRSEFMELFSGNLEETLLKGLLLENNPEKIAFYWAKGGKIPWESVHEGEEVNRISLPTYPFEKRRCWMEFRPGCPGLAQSHQPLSRPMETKGDCPVPNEQVGAIISGLLGMGPAKLNYQQPLEQYGFDSIMLLQLLQKLQIEFDPSVNLEDLQKCGTVQAVIDTLQRRNDDKPVSARKSAATALCARLKFPELIHLNTSYQGLPVFWFHSGLGGVETYRELAQKSKRPFYGIQARGWMTNRCPLRGIQAMATYYVHIIQSLQPQGPYDLGGYSLGGALAYEVTRQLQELGETVATIVMLDALDSTALKRLNNCEKSSILQMVNAALISSVSETDAPSQIMIHRDEVNTDGEAELFLKQLVELAQKRGLKKTETQLKTMIRNNAEIQKAYEIDRFTVLPLPDAQKVTCYYFRNQSGLFYGELEPYSLVAADAAIFVEQSEYWKEWERQFQNFESSDVEAKCHMTLLADPKAREAILTFCEILYSGKTVAEIQS
jgi:acyl transferase domain-containing protein/thioesterase domain-containing protein/acyl carrier protein/SAM-dependent methyltransferase